MDSVGTIIFSILFVFVIGFIIYFTIDYLKYKEEIKNKMEQNAKIDFTITSNLDIVDKSLTKKHNDDSSHLNAFDNALKNYFSFGDNNLSIQNEKLFEHVFSRISPNLELLAHVNTAQGLMVNTNNEVLDSRNMKICNNDKNCIYMNVNDHGFNITPDNVSNLTINSTDKTPLAKFDLENNSIYFGGDDLNSPMFIRDDKVFIHDINMIVKPENTVFDHDNVDDLSYIPLSGVKIHKMKNTIISVIHKALTVIKKEYNKFIVYYTIDVRTYSAKDASGKRKYYRKIDIHFHTISNYDYVENDDLTFVVPFLKPEDTSKTKTESMETNIVPRENISLHTHDSKFKVTIKLKNKLPSQTFVKFSLSGWNIGDITKSSSGILIGEKQST